MTLVDAGAFSAVMNSHPPTLEALLRSATTDPSAKPRPVELWDPPYCGDIGLKILRDATWIYGGTPIGRVGLVKLFASLLRKDADGRTYLVTPVEKVDVMVEDAPFLAVELAVDGAGPSQRVTLRTNVDDVVAIDGEHPVRFISQDPDGGLKPYVLVRGRLEALFTRAMYADLVSLCEERAGDAVGGGGTFGFWSGGQWWPMMAQPAPGARSGG